VHFIEVGQDDATLLVHDDATMLVDTGDWQRSDVVGYQNHVGVDEFDIVAITYLHADHIGQFDRVMDTVDVAELYWPGTVTTSQTFEPAVDALEASDADYAEPRAGDTTTVEPLQVDIVGPDDDADFSDVQDAGLSLRVTYGDSSFLFTGDIEAASEPRMVSGWADQTVAEVYQVGHHGSDTSSTPPLVDLLAGRMQVAVGSVGTLNSYGRSLRCRPGELPEFEQPSSDPLALLATWVATAQEAGVREPKALALATSDRDGCLSSRIVLVKESTVDGIVFGTSRRSREEQNVDQQPRAAGTLYWRETLQQVRRAGAVRPLPDRTSDAVFVACPREAQATAWSSHQSQPLRDEASLRRRTAALVDGDDPLGRLVD